MTIGDKIPRKKSVVGYKMVLKDEHGKYRSIYTYQIYQIEKPIQKANKNTKVYSNCVPWFFTDFVHFCWNDDYNGFTSAYQNSDDCVLQGLHQLPENSSAKVVKIQVTLAGDLHEGTYIHPVYIGKKIMSIKEIKEFDK